jgi:hypothetical protein
VYVPREIFLYLGFVMPKGTPLYHLTWQFCYAARREAEKWITQQDVGESISHWTDILLNVNGQNNFNMSLIDIIQAQAANKWKETSQKEDKDPYFWYDTFIRPTEILLARKAAMNDKLVLSFKCQQHTSDFFQLVCNLVNIPTTIPLTAVECVEEMSKIRHLPAKAMIQITDTDIPLTITLKVRLECSAFRIWDNICEADLPASASSSGRGSFTSITNPIIDVQESYVDSRISECQYEMQQIRDIKRRTNDFISRAESEDPPLYGQQPTTQKELERKYYYTRLQFLDIKMQMIQEEMELLQAQREQIQKSQKSFQTMDIHEIDDIIFEMNTEKQKMEAQEHNYQKLLSDTPDTDENKDKRAQIIYSHRLLQIRLKKITDQLEEAQRNRHIRRIEKEHQPTGGPPPTNTMPSVRPKDTINYPDSTFYKATHKSRKTDPYAGIFEVPKYSTLPTKPVEDRKKNTSILTNIRICSQARRKDRKCHAESIAKNDQNISIRLFENKNHT